MDFTLDNEQKALREAVREMATRFTITDAIGPAPFDADQWGALAEMGVLFEEGIGPVEEMVVAEELGRARVRSPYAESLLTSAVLTATGHDDLVRQMSKGTAVVMPALAEPSRAWGADPTVTLDGGNLNGRKDPVPFVDALTHAVVSTTGGLYLVEGPPVDRTGLWFRATPGTKLADDASPLQPALNRATVAMCAEALGAMSAAVDLTVGYLKTRRQFGVPLMSFQALSHRAADLYVSLELARSTVQYAAMALAEDPTDGALVSRTKVVVGKAGRLIGQEAIQMHGGIGMTAEYAVGHLTARLSAIEHTYGDTRQHLARLAGSVADHTTVEVL
jgi:alkylation response protein AidB-like acyl-CoA dehydrogenase